MDIARQVEAMSPTSIQSIASAALGTAKIDLVTISASPIDYPVFNPISGGIVRASGTARLNGAEQRHWSAILKICKSPVGGMTPRGIAPAGWGDDPHHWNYWKREPLAYQSGLLADLPRGISAPRCYGVDERDDGTIWLWMEEIADEGDPSWPPERFETLATDFGAFGGAYLIGREIPHYQWLESDWLRSWIDDAWDSLVPLIANPAAWDLPMVRAAFPRPVADRLEELWSKRVRMLDALAAVPTTLCHRDAYPSNMFTRRNPDGKSETVAVDWTQMGRGPIGHDLGQILIPSLLFFWIKPEDIASMERRLFAAYIRGLRSTGWTGDTEVVRFGFAATTSLHWCFAGAFALRWARDSRISDGMARRWGRPIEEIIAQRAAVTYYLLDLADEACAHPLFS